MKELPKPPALERIATGSAEADAVLCGGFPARALHVVMGSPGTGKTILAQQILFNNANDDRPVVYLTTVSEPLSKVLTFLQELDFYDEGKLLDSVLYEDVAGAVLRDGPEALVSLVEDLIRTKRPKLLVIDSFKAVHDLAESESQMRRICFALGAVLSAYDITTFLVGEYEDEDVATQPEFAVADGIVQLERRASYARDERYLRVLKLRGSPYAEGAHALTISSAGIQVYPRLVSPREPRDYEPLMERIGTGDEGLDAITGGGLWRGSTTLVQGSAGTGKTTLALGFVLAGVQQGEPSLYLHLQENPIQLGQTIAALGKDVDDLQKEGLYLRYLSPVELKIDSVVLELRDVIEKHGIQRVAIDALTEVRWASSSQDRFHDFVYALGQHFRVHQVTALLTLEIPPGSYAIHGQPQSRVSTLCDGLISLKVVDGEAPERRIRVVKMRGSAHPLESRPFKIRDTGVVVAPGADG